MKPFGKTNDGVTDRLLRAYVSRPSNPSQTCPEFDPDLANAYIERRLPSGSRSRYELHLSDCGACRKNVVALARMSDIPDVVSPAPDGAGWLSGLRRVFEALSLPQWAMATAAALVLAISLPVILSRESARSNQQVPASITTDQQSQVNPQSPKPGAPAEQSQALSQTSKSTGADTSESVAAQMKKREAEEAPASPEAGRAAAAPSVVAGVVDDLKKADVKSPSPREDEAQRKSQSEVASEAPVQAGAATSQVAKNLSEESRQKQEKDAQPAPESKPGRVDEPRDKEKVARAEEVGPPPAPAASSEAAKSRGALRRSQANALRDSGGGATESVRSNERRINKKGFFFRDSTWTDKDYDPNKDLPVVTIIRDSNVYNELLAKRASLRPYLEGFSDRERAIIVYKGTVYKLIPQK